MKTRKLKKTVKLDSMQIEIKILNSVEIPWSVFYFILGYGSFKQYFR